MARQAEEHRRPRGLVGSAAEADAEPQTAAGLAALREETAAIRARFLESYPSVRPASVPIVSFDRSMVNPFVLVEP